MHLAREDINCDLTLLRRHVLFNLDFVEVIELDQWLFVRHEDIDSILGVCVDLLNHGFFQHVFCLLNRAEHTCNLVAEELEVSQLVFFLQFLQMIEVLLSFFKLLSRTSHLVFRCVFLIFDRVSLLFNRTVTLVFEWRELG